MPLEREQFEKGGCQIERKNQYCVYGMAVPSYPGQWATVSSNLMRFGVTLIHSLVTTEPHLLTSANMLHSPPQVMCTASSVSLFAGCYQGRGVLRTVRLG
jgi:hypothetical protein